jgi:3-oxoacyl-[acyl-carrier protein] reductase
MDFGLTNRTVLVLGGGGGFGRAIAKALAGEGASIAVASIHRASTGAALPGLYPANADTKTRYEAFRAAQDK